MICSFHLLGANIICLQVGSTQNVIFKLLSVLRFHLTRVYWNMIEFRNILWGLNWNGNLHQKAFDFIRT